MTTTWARVAVDKGERVVSLVPEMISWLTAQVHGGHGVGVDLTPVGEVAEIAGVGGIAAEGSGVAIEDGGQLLAGEPAVRGEGGVRRAVDDAVDVGPDHGTVIIGADVEILKVGADGDRGGCRRRDRGR